MANPVVQPTIVDVRIPDDVQQADGDGVRDQIVAGLSKPAGLKTLPTLLLYDEQGLKLYDKITTDCHEYYPFAAEEQILKSKADEIVRIMHAKDAGKVTDGEVVLELGAGALRKTSHILLALSRLVSHSSTEDEAAPITYYALDLEKRELDRTLQLVTSQLGDELKGKVDTKGMWGTYDGGLKFVQEGGLLDEREKDKTESAPTMEAYRVERTAGDVNTRGRDSSPASFDSTTDSTWDTSMTPPSTPGPMDQRMLQDMTPLHIMFLGSSLGNFPSKAATAFLRGLPLRAGSGDTLLIGLDHDNEKKKIELAYNDPAGITKEFIMNGLKGAGRALGNETLFEEDKWEYVAWYNEQERCHEAYYKSTVNQTLHDPATKSDFTFLANELINIEVSYKYSDMDVYGMFASADLRPVMRWTDESDQYSLWLVERPAFVWPLLKTPTPTSTPFGVPDIEEFRTMWKAWDVITLGMIPDSMMFTKPIHLRHICLFYLGHIPTFLDIHLARLLGDGHTEPEEYKYIFERGIDPHVDDPNQCHPHSEVPQKDEDWPALSSITDFRDRVRLRVEKLYDDIASGKVKLTRKIGRVLFMTLEHEGFHAETLLYMLLQRSGTLGGTIPPPGFIAPNWEVLSESWKKISPPVSSTVTLGPAKITLGIDDIEEEDTDAVKTLDVDGHEFGWDNEHPKREVQVNEFKIEWRPVSNGEFYEFWKADGQARVKLPASWIEIDGEMQVRTLYGPISLEIAQDWPLLASYDDLSVYAQIKGGRIPTEPELRLFFDKFQSGYEGGSNIGFRNWHPLPATAGGVKDGGMGHNGGVWEWTSTVFDTYDGFAQSKLYPGYSTDFFDGKHQVVIGGSYATIPRLAERRSLRNYYQHNYPYAWVAARIAYDV